MKKVFQHQQQNLTPIMRHILFVLGFLLLQLHARAYTVQYDSAAVNTRHFDSLKIVQLKKEFPFKYGRMQPQHEINFSFFEQIERFIERVFGQWAQLPTPYKILRVVLYLAGIVFLLYLLFQIFNVQQIFARKAAAVSLNYELMNEDIHEMNFEPLIEAAIAQQQYRLAIRLHYLHTLKLLADHQLIDWKLNKTNYQYVIEMQARPSKDTFEQLTNIFDWVWYGEFLIQEQEYLQFSQLFTAFKKEFHQPH